MKGKSTSKSPIKTGRGQKAASTMSSIVGMMNEKNHVVDFDIPPVKLFGITIRKGFTATKFVKCECGESARERMIKSFNKPNRLFEELVEKGKCQSK